MTTQTANRDLRCRLAEQNDLPAIIDLLADDEFGKTRNPRYTDAAELYDAAFAQLLGNADNTIVVGEQADVLVGCYQLTFIRGLSHRGAVRAQIESVRIASAVRGQGLGDLLMRDAIDRARARGANLVQLTTDLRRPHTQRFYERLGFVTSHAGMKLVL